MLGSPLTVSFESICNGSVYLHAAIHHHHVHHTIEMLEDASALPLHLDMTRSPLNLKSLIPPATPHSHSTQSPSTLTNIGSHCQTRRFLAAEILTLVLAERFLPPVLACAPSWLPRS